MKIWLQSSCQNPSGPKTSKSTLSQSNTRGWILLLLAVIFPTAPAAIAFSAEQTPRELASRPPNKIAATSLRVKVTGVRNGEGDLAIAIFHADQADAFPKDPKAAVASKLVEAKEGETVVEFQDLTPGEYAVSLLHDENQDGKMNFSFVGMPKEGFGFSQNPKIYFGAPDFSKCAFGISVPVTDVQVTTKYY